MFDGTPVAFIKVPEEITCVTAMDLEPWVRHRLEMFNELMEACDAFERAYCAMMNAEICDKLFQKAHEKFNYVLEKWKEVK